MRYIKQVTYSPMLDGVVNRVFSPPLRYVFSSNDPEDLIGYCFGGYSEVEQAIFALEGLADLRANSYATYDDFVSLPDLAFQVLNAVRLALYRQETSDYTHAAMHYLEAAALLRDGYHLRAGWPLSLEEDADA